MYYVGICDDEKGLTVMLEMVTADFFESRKIDCEIIVTHDPEEFLEHSDLYDLVIMDINLRSDIDGVQTTYKMREVNEDAQIIYLTGFNYKAEAINTNCFHYLLKPFDINVYIGLLEKVLRHLPMDTERIRLETTDGTISIKLNTLFYFERHDSYTKIVTLTKTYKTSLYLNELEEKLKEYPMWRCHRSYLVNMGAIRQQGENEIITKNGVIIPVSRRRSKEHKN